MFSRTTANGLSAWGRRRHRISSRDPRSETRLSMWRRIYGATNSAPHGTGIPGPPRLSFSNPLTCRFIFFVNGKSEIKRKKIATPGATGGKGEPRGPRPTQLRPRYWAQRWITTQSWSFLPRPSHCSNSSMLALICPPLPLPPPYASLLFKNRAFRSRTKKGGSQGHCSQRGRGLS